MNYVSAKEIRERLHISGVTLMRWKNENKIACIKLSDRKCLYDIDSIIQNADDHKRKNVIYGRVQENQNQSKELNMQIELIKQYMLSKGVSVDDVYSDVASGLNENRDGFNSLLEQVFKKEIDTVYVTYRDRLTRFGFDYFSKIFSYFGTKIVVLDNKEETNALYQKELTDDLVTLMRSYSTKLDNGRKKVKNIENILRETDIKHEN